MALRIWLRYKFTIMDIMREERKKLAIMMVSGHVAALLIAPFDAPHQSPHSLISTRDIIDGAFPSNNSRSLNQAPETREVNREAL